MPPWVNFFWNVGMGAALMMLSQIIFTWDKAVASAHWWEALSALGTVLAVFVALGIALRDSSRRKAEEDVRAGMAYEQIYLTVKQLNFDLYAVTFALNTLMKYQDGHRQREIALNAVQYAIEQLKVDIPADVLQGLVHAPHGRGMQISILKAGIPGLAARFRAVVVAPNYFAVQLCSLIAAEEACRLGLVAAHFIGKTGSEAEIFSKGVDPALKRFVLEGEAYEA